MGDELTPDEAKHWRRLEAQLRTQQDADRAIAVASIRAGLRALGDAFVVGFRKGAQFRSVEAQRQAFLERYRGARRPQLPPRHPAQHGDPYGPRSNHQLGSAQDPADPHSL